MSQKVVLLGSGGQLGLLVAANVPQDVFLHAFTRTQLDITDESAVRETLNKIQPDIIINTAAYTAVDKAESEPERAFAINSHGPVFLAEHAPENCRIIHVSTDFVFDGTSRQPYQIDAATNPVSIYGRSKLEGETRLLESRPDTACIIRTAWLYSQEGRNFVNTMLALMGSRESLSVVSDQIGTPTSAHTLAKVIWMFAEKPASGIYHWTDQGQSSWYEFACKIQAFGFELGLLEKKIPVKAISTAEYPTPATRPAYSTLDKTATYAHLGFTGRTWEEELYEVLHRKSEVFKAS